MSEKLACTFDVLKDVKPSVLESIQLIHQFHPWFFLDNVVYRAGGIHHDFVNLIESASGGVTDQVDCSVEPGFETSEAFNQDIELFVLIFLIHRN